MSPSALRVAALLLSLSAAPVPAAVVYSASGATPAIIQPLVDSFRTALGALNANTTAFFPGGRREINWDGVPDALASPNALPANFFNANSPRGVMFSTPGSGFQVSARTSSGTTVRFGNININYSAIFQTFTAERLFTAIGSNTVQVDFFVPGTSTPATVSGFGAVFTDVDTVGGTTMTITLGDGSNGGQFTVPASASGGLSFLGLTDPYRISRVVIQSGTAALGAAVNDSPGTGVDLVVMDDFIYGEPQVQLRRSIDVDGNGTADALTDGLLLLRYLFGLRGASLVSGAVDAAGTRKTPETIEPYINSLLP